MLFKAEGMLKDCNESENQPHRNEIAVDVVIKTTPLFSPKLNSKMLQK